MTGLLFIQKLSRYEQAAIESAKLYSEAISEFRTLYSEEVVAIVKKEGIQIRHDYKSHESSIPLPATLSMLLGKKIGESNSGAETHLFSGYPFPWRKSDNKLLFKQKFIKLNN